MTFIQRRPNVFDVGATLHKCYTNVLCLLGDFLPSVQLANSSFTMRVFLGGGGGRPI